MSARLDPIQVLVEYAKDIKPYHTKIYEVILSYVYSEQCNVTISEVVEWLIDTDINYFTEYCIYNGWDIPPWGGFWKPGGILHEQIVEIVAVGPDPYFAIAGDWTTFFASDQLEKGLFGLRILSVNPSTNIITCAQPIPWVNGDPVRIASSALPYPGIVPTPLSPFVTYYVIPVSPTSFKLATSVFNAFSNIAIDITSVGAGILTAQLATYYVTVHNPASNWVVNDVQFWPSQSILDIDFNGVSDALTDAVLIIRYLFGVRGPALIAGAIGANAKRNTYTQIEAYIASILTDLDIDGNGSADALTDGVLIERYLFGLRGASLISGAIGPGATRTTAPQIEAYIETLLAVSGPVNGSTRIYASGIGSLSGGYIDVYRQSNWDNPQECLDPITGLPTASDTTIAVKIEESLETDFGETKFIDLIAVGTFPENYPSPWGGDEGVVIESVFNINIEDNTFDLRGDWRSYFGELFFQAYPTTSITIPIHSPGLHTFTIPGISSIVYVPAAGAEHEKTRITVVEPLGQYVPLDIDGNGIVDNNDALLIFRYMIGLRGFSLISGAIGVGAIRSTAESIESYLAYMLATDIFDVDGNGTNDGLTDGLLISRYIAGLTGVDLIDSAIGVGATRTTAVEIETYLATLTGLVGDVGGIFAGHTPYVQLFIHSGEPGAYPPGTPHYSWDTMGWDMPGDDSIIADTTFSETLEIVVDQDGIPMVGAWDGTRWDYSQFN